MAQFATVLKLAELPLGGMRACLIGAREIVLCHTREGVFALDNICTHAHARLCEGRLRATRLVCPLHGASFDIRDGRVLGPPATVALPTHAVRVVDGAIEVALAEPA
ncbi:MAG TPA: non-heme iron oxygenase ferredoxin subunit [Steroidobacteraceae bacterium]|jgi:nitrite reductase/ring-hydroxylating ferredoxin subunit